MKNLVSKLNARELADTADADVSTSRALPYQPAIYRIRIEGERTRMLTLAEALLLSAGIVILPRSIECEAEGEAR